MDRYPEKRDLFSGVLSVPGGRYIVEDNRRKFVAGWADLMGIGIFAAIISALTGGEIGAGDGLLIIAMGSVMTAGELIGILFAALLLCGIYSGIQLLVLKKQRDIEIPFVPFCLQVILEVYFCEKTEKRKFYVGSGTADAVIAHGYYEYVVSGFFCT